MTFHLVQCDVNGRPMEPVGPLPEFVAENCVGGAALYASVGFVPPWVGYIAVDDGKAVGGGAFVGAPKDNCVEIAYYTVKELEGRGYAGKTAAALVDIARKAASEIALVAHTLPEQNASTAILAKLGFTQTGTAEDPDAGTVWEWRRTS